MRLSESIEKSGYFWLPGNSENRLPGVLRIKQMIEPFRHLFGNPKERKSFIGKVIDTRSYLTHYDSRLANQAVDGEELWKLCTKLEALFQLHFLRLIGLDVDSINKIVKENHSLSSKIGI